MKTLWATGGFVIQNQVWYQNLKDAFSTWGRVLIGWKQSKSQSGDWFWNCQEPERIVLSVLSYNRPVFMNAQVC